MRSFSVFLLKVGYDHTNCFEEDAGIGESIDTNVLPDNAKLFVFDNPPKPPLWRQYFSIDFDLFQVLKGAILTIPVENRVFCLTFGHVAHKLLDTSYEYDFGIQVTLNCLDPSKIKNTDTLLPASSMRQRTQVSSDTELVNFDFDRNSTIVKSLTGKVRDEYGGIIKSATGAAHLRVGTDSAPEEFPEFCANLLELYLSDAHEEHFPDLRNIVPIHDPLIIENLNRRLIDAIIADEHVGLTIPEIIDYQDAILVRFKGARGPRTICHDVHFDEYANYLAARGIGKREIDIELLKKHRMYLCDEDGTQKGKSYSIYKSLVFDAELEGDRAIYHLSEGGWYRVDGDFIAKLSDYLDPLFCEQQLPNYVGGGEGAYNNMASDQAMRVCLDQENISPRGQRQLEPCDIAQLDQNNIVLTHVKISTRSSLLSHLFNQGINSFDLIRSQVEARERLGELILNRCNPDFVDDWSLALNNERYAVRYGVISHKDPRRKSKNLPLFSRISLFRIMQDLQTRGVELSIEFIQDET